MKIIKPRGYLFLQILGVIVAALFASVPAWSWDKGSLTDYHDRRARLIRETGDGVVVLFGYSEDEIAVSTTSFRQNEMFYYLTGWNEPDGILMLVPKAAKSGGGTGGG